MRSQTDEVTKDAGDKDKVGFCNMVAQNTTGRRWKTGARVSTAKNQIFHQWQSITGEETLRVAKKRRRAVSVAFTRRLVAVEEVLMFQERGHGVKLGRIRRRPSCIDLWRWCCGRIYDSRPVFGAHRESLSQASLEV